METQTHSYRKISLKSFSHAIRGIKIFYRFTPNAIIHSLFAVTAVFLSFRLKITTVEWLFVIASIAMVFIAEMFNTALELLTDYVSEDFHIKAKNIKDCAAGAVFLASVIALIIGAIIFLPKLLLV